MGDGQYVPVTGYNPYITDEFCKQDIDPMKVKVLKKFNNEVPKLKKFDILFHCAFGYVKLEEELKDETTPQGEEQEPKQVIKMWKAKLYLPDSGGSFEEVFVEEVDLKQSI